MTGSRDGAPPPWIPVAAVGALPASLVLAALTGHGEDTPAIAALVVGAFITLLLVCWWCIPGGLRQFSQAIAIALLGSVTLVTAIILLSALADRALRSDDRPTSPNPEVTDTEAPPATVTPHGLAP